MNFKVRFLADTSVPLYDNFVSRRIAYDEKLLSCLEDLKQSHKVFNDVRVFDAASLNALIKAVRGGIFGRGSLGRFMLLFIYKDCVATASLFTIEKGSSAWVPNYEGIHIACPELSS